MATKKKAAAAPKKTTTRSAGKKATTKKKAAAAGAPTPKEMLLVGSKVRNEIKNTGCNTASDALDGLNDWIYWLIRQGTARAAANGRKTVRAHDFMIM